ncbi:MAG TPA: winged helix-turn-helix domain-containing protein [Pyrinomonadaceae bacterium]|nr:winged helix-turn-helix domain-containing protein [Pyrinomonadaceae bacterium]
MYSDNSKPICFDQFRFDPDRFALYYRGELVKSAEKKQLEVLLTFLRRPNELVTYDEVIENVWHDNIHGATSTRVNQYVSRLQKTFHEYVPENSYFENVKGRGYIFRVMIDADEPESQDNSTSSPSNLDRDSHDSEQADIKRSLGKTKAIVLGLSLATVLVVLAAFWIYTRPNDETVIKEVVRESQLYESLVLYENPTLLNESDLDKYWTKEVDSNINYDRGRIRDSVKKMIAEGRRYGAESKCEQFDFQSVEIDINKTTAVVKTLEKWFVSIYSTDGSLLKNRTIGPYFVSYILKKINGKWLIEKSTTGRVIRPVPRLREMTPITTIVAGQQFWLKVVGDDLEPEMVFFEVVGPGCPEAKPCKVPNDVLREHSTMNSGQIVNVPLTLASGVFKITARNGDSQASEPVMLTVP